MNVAAVVGLGARRPKRPECLNADLKSIKSLTVVWKVQAVRLMLPQPPARTEPAERTAIAEHIKGRDGLRDDARFAEGDGGDQRAQPASMPRVIHGSGIGSQARSTWGIWMR